MKTIILATAIAAVVAGPALAASSKATHHVHHAHQVTHPNTPMLTDPIGVYVNGQEVGRDPDPNIREEILRDYYIEQAE